MKKIFTTIMALMLVASAANAQSGILGSLGKIFGGNSENKENSTAGNLLESVLGTVISQAVTVSLPGTWTYSGIASAIETENTLTTLAASTYKENLENKLDGYLKKVGIVPGVATITFNNDNSFAIVSGAKTIASGTYTYDNKAIVMKFGKLYNYLTMEGTVTASTSGAQVLFDANKFLEFAKKAVKVVGAKSSNSTVNTIASLTEQLSGLKLGFDLKK
ncbi:MAG: DUF4923 family protein [Bacteroidales bacterium]|nr:DUF4923 family protein [Bacteroidales bacterium]MBR5055487.1 DUF4923 family protein [Bacteroidales bacterium]